MIDPILSDAKLLAQMRATSNSSLELCLWWLGQSGFLARWNSRFVLFDPYLSDSLTNKYANTDKPHIRMTRIPIAPTELRFVDLVTASHQHTDHLDSETLTPIFDQNAGPILIAPAAHRDLVIERSRASGDQIQFLSDGMSCEVNDIRIHAVPAAHESIERDKAGNSKYLGFIVQMGSWTIYHSGDTVRFDGLAELLAPWRVDIGLLPINGRLASRRVAGNLSGREAVELARDAQIGLAIPCHYEMFTFNTVTPAEFVEAARHHGQPFALLRCGEMRVFQDPRSGL